MSQLPRPALPALPALPDQPPAGCAACLSRRAFLSQATLAAAALALAACGGDNLTAPASVSGSIRVSDYPALAAAGGVALVTVDGASLAVVHVAGSEYVALSRVCPHQGGNIVPSGGGFLCTEHGARFDETGTWVGGQRTSNMRAYPASYDAATGVLTIG